jgi:hypothetical protein
MTCSSNNLKSGRFGSVNLTVALQMGLQGVCLQQRFAWREPGRSGWNRDVVLPPKIFRSVLSLHMSEKKNWKHQELRVQQQMQEQPLSLMVS